MHQSHERITNDFTAHAATGMSAELHDAVRTNFANIAHWVVDNAPKSYAREEAIKKLREAMFWTNAAIACDSNTGSTSALVDAEPPQ